MLITESISTKKKGGGRQHNSAETSVCAPLPFQTRKGASRNTRPLETKAVGKMLLFVKKKRNAKFENQ